MNNIQQVANKMLQDAIKMIGDCGIKVPVTIKPVVELNTTAKKRWGQCRKRFDGYTISINKTLMELEDKSGALNTMIHEVLHTIEGCMNHGKQWKAYATTIKSKYGIDIKRTSSASEKGIEPSMIPLGKYVVRCTGCGKTWSRERKSKLITQVHRFRCDCGSSIERVI